MGSAASFARGSVDRQQTRASSVTPNTPPTTSWFDRRDRRLSRNAAVHPNAMYFTDQHGTRHYSLISNAWRSDVPRNHLQVNRDEFLFNLVYFASEMQRQEELTTSAERADKITEYIHQLARKQSSICSDGLVMSNIEEHPEGTIITDSHDEEATTEPPTEKVNSDAPVDKHTAKATQVSMTVETQDLSTEESEMCAICAEPTTVMSSDIESSSVQLPCSHRFHTKCILKWLIQGKPTCPYCRAPVCISPFLPNASESRNNLRRYSESWVEATTRPHQSASSMDSSSSSSSNSLDRRTPTRRAFDASEVARTMTPNEELAIALLHMNS